MAKCGLWVENLCNWKLVWCREMFEWEAKLAEELLLILSQVKLNLVCADKPYQGFDISGVFLVK